MQSLEMLFFFRKKLGLISLSFPLMLFVACQEQPSSSNNPTTGGENNHQDNYTVNVDNLRVRATPGKAGKVLEQLEKGTAVTGSGEISNFNESIMLRGIPFNEPWYKIKTLNGLEGWVFGGGLSFKNVIPQKRKKDLINRRLAGIFGNSITQQMNDYQQLFERATTSSDFAGALQKGMSVRDSINHLLTNKIEVDDPVTPADLSWLETAMPGFVVGIVAEGTLYYLFADFNQLKEKSTLTDGNEDDEFIQLNLTINPYDGTEQLFPVWFLQTWDYGGHSLLGQGKHLEVLEKLEKLKSKTDLFQTDLAKIKTRIFEDIMGEYVTYYEPKELIIKELNTIIEKNFSSFSVEEKILLQQRKVAFQNPTQNQIDLNMRTQ